MRVTNTMLTRNYLNNLNRNLDLYNQSGSRLQSGRKFTKMSENVSDGTRALNVRTQVYKNEQYQENVKKAGESLDDAETNITSIEDILNSVWEQTIKACNGTNESASEIFSINFSSIKNQVIEFANCKYNDMYVLGGTNNSEPPFNTDKDGALLYNGVRVDDIIKKDGKFLYSQTEETENPVLDENGDQVSDDDGNLLYYKEVPESGCVYMDIGIGLSVKNGIVDPRTAFNMSVSGLDVLGYGRSDITYQDTMGENHTINVPNNAYELLDEMSKALDEKDFDKLSALNEHLKGTINDLITEISDVGVRTNYLENHLGRLENEEDYMTEIQTNLEYISDPEEISKHEMLKYTWLLTLQYGGSVMPKSLMDYIQ